MLNRLNELNIIRSYCGTYDLYNTSTPSNTNNNNHHYTFQDKKLSLHIDLKGGHEQENFQLTTSHDTSALFYGELYNFDDLINKINWNDGDKKFLSFSHLCCLLYQKFGCHFAKHINGMFSLVLRDQKEDLLLLIVDRFGAARPLYYKASSKLFFSSHLKNLLLNNTISLDIDKASLALFLKYAYIPSPKSIIKGINKLKAGEMIICKDGRYKIERYINFLIKSQKYSEDEAVFQYTKLLNESISTKLDTFNGQNIGIFLSGGLDSSANVALAAGLNKCKFKTFGVGFDNPEIDERPYAKIVAEHFDIPFYDYVFDGRAIEDLPKMIWYLEEPFLENGLFLTYAGFKSVQNMADIIISGNCTDQLFGTGGFAGCRPIALRYILEKSHILHLIEPIKKITRKTLFYKDNIFFKLKVLLDRGSNFNDWFFWGFDEYELAKICNFDISIPSLNFSPNDLSNIPLKFPEYFNHSLIHQDIEHYTCQNILVKSYRIAEMFDTYSRDPYLDYKLVDFLLSLEMPLKRKGCLLDYFKNKTKSKYLHQLAMGKILPDNILNKPKQGGFVNMASLLNDPHRKKIIFNYILNSDIIKEYLNIQYVKKLFLEYDALRTQKIYWAAHRDSKAGKILYLLTLSLWYNIFLNNKTKIDYTLKLSDILSN